MNNNTNTMALVTGASSGIGYELAKLLAQNGHHLILVSRSKEELNIIAQSFTSQYGIKAIPLVKDLFEPNAAEELYNEVKALGLHVDILVNDAAQGVYGKFAETDLQSELDIIQLNISSLVVLTKLFLKDMLAANGGKILQLASVVGKIASPLMAVYAGTKAFVYNFTQSVINELKDTNVTMTALLPGATDTDFFNKAGAEDASVVQEGKLANPADVAKDGYDALMSGDSKIISGMKNKMEMAMGNFMPDEALAERVRKQNEPKTD
jgi:short-subunit dehydrogenase